MLMNLYCLYIYINTVNIRVDKNNNNKRVILVFKNETIPNNILVFILMFLNILEKQHGVPHGLSIII